jgi:hypothetical protein
MRYSAPQSLRQFWETWKRITHKIGTFQARVLLTVLYALLVFPFGLAVRLFADPLRIKRRPTTWLERPTEECDLEWARRQ